MSKKALVLRGGWKGHHPEGARQQAKYQWMTGGQWVAHPGNSIPNYRVDVVNDHRPVAPSPSTWLRASQDGF